MLKIAIKGLNKQKYHFQDKTFLKIIKEYKYIYVFNLNIIIGF